MNASSNSAHSAATGAIEVKERSLKERFASIPESDYVRDGLALLLLALSLTLPSHYAGSGQPVKDPLFLGAVVVAAIALAFPYAARFGLLPKNWTVAKTRAVRLVLAVPFIALYLWQIVNVAFLSGSDVWATGAAWAIGGAGVALAAQARASELGAVEEDTKATSTARLFAIGLTVLVAVGFLITAVERFETFELLVVVLASGALVFLPAFGAAIKRTRAWGSFLIGFAAVILAVLYLTANDAASLMPKYEAMTLGDFGGLHPLSMNLGVGLFMIPALAAVVSAPAFRRSTKRASDVEERLDLVAIVLRVMLAAGVLFMVSFLAYAAFMSESARLQHSVGMSAIIAAAVASLLVAVVAIVALRSFNKNPGTSRAPVSIALALGVILGFAISAISPFQGLSFGHIVLILVLPVLGIYALIGNSASRDYYAGASKSRPEPSLGAYIWSKKPVAQPVAAAPYQTGAVPVAQQSVATSVAPESAAQPVVSPVVEDHATGDDLQKSAISQEIPVAQTGPSGGEETQVMDALPVEDTTINPRNDARRPLSTPTETIDRTEILALEDTSTGALSLHGYTEAEALNPDTPAIVLAKIAEVAPELRPALAVNPSTYPALVDWLGQLGDPAVNAALAKRA